MRDGLIDRKVLLKQLETMALNAPDSKRATFSKVISAVELQSPADYEIVKNGFWDDSNDGITPYCSVCHMAHSWWKRNPDYCPNCGAKMEGEKL